MSTLKSPPEKLTDMQVANIMIDLPAFAQTHGVETAAFHISCALRDLSCRPDITERERAFFETAHDAVIRVCTARTLASSKTNAMSVPEQAAAHGLVAAVDRMAGKQSTF